MKRSSARLDGKKKLVALTRELEQDIKAYCAERGVESESELIRQALVKYLDADCRDGALKFSGLKSLAENVESLRDMLTVLFQYLRMMHVSILAYHPEIEEEFKTAAFASAQARHEKFYGNFRERLRDDPAFFEKLLHGYVTGELDGQA